MAVQFKTIARINPANPSDPAKYYASIVNNGEIDLDKLTRLIGNGSTLREADVYAVLISLVNIVEEELADGRIVRLGKLGSLSLGIQSSGEVNEEDVSANNIVKSKIRYRTSPRLKEMLNNIKYRKIQT